MEKQKGKKRELLLCIEPDQIIRKNLRETAFAQILANISKFKASEKASDEEKICENVYYIVLHNPKNERRVLEIIRKFNFQIVSD